MTKNQLKTKRGFTIIEVVLVLAIAGLIFMMVFLALPALQRSQRDTQRRDDMSRFIAQINQYQANNRGKVPTAAGEHKWDASDTGDWRTFHDGYLVGNGDDFTDPGGSGYWVNDHGKITADTTLPAGTTSVDYFIHVYHGASCSDVEGTVKKSENASDRKIAILYKLEGAGVYCGES
ncbi:type II secretion system protein [Candidatus Saccharibacteria bacterium]|nr:type II secretion system protein [Candidatus Saccharibacteria bacterium]